MRTILVGAAALATGFILSAVAQQPSQSSTGCGPSGTGAHASQGIAQGGFTKVEAAPRALVIHAIDPDGNPVMMIVTPAAAQ
ncbi:MAG: hypothetical protein QOD93_4520 [Acetobacteraceae bacterium]|jgi:hypothetical protein|nr:hypothetical protein [Acetobacteraceae bacterium]MEA2771558.1 hypothetical protein [Acetobacteraceae bacterium]